MEPSKEERELALSLVRQLQTGPAQKWLPDKMYFAQYDSAVEWAKECIEDDGSVPHTFYLHGKEKNGDKWTLMPVMLADWPPPDGKKYEAMQGLGVMFTEKLPDYLLYNVVHVSESWIANYAPEDRDPDGDPRYLRKGIPTPEQRDDRIECLTVSATSKDLRITYENIEMIRDEDGKFKGWGRIFGKRYDPSSEADPREGADHLAMEVIRGYLAASLNVQEK